MFHFRHFQGGVCYSKARLDGKTVIITGGNTGIGKETAIDLARRGARVIIACRDADRAEVALQEIVRKSGSTNVVYYNLDLASLESVRTFAQCILKEEARLDILINNAGVMQCPYWKTAEGHEMQFGVNHLGHFLLTVLLLDRLKEAPVARIVVVSSRAYRRGEINFYDIDSENDYNSWAAYCQSKLANNLFTRALAKRLKGTNVTVNCLHPGRIWTEFGRHVVKEIPLWRKVHLMESFSISFCHRIVVHGKFTLSQNQSYRHMCPIYSLCGSLSNSQTIVSR